MNISCMTRIFNLNFCNIASELYEIISMLELLSARYRMTFFEAFIDNTHGILEVVSL